MEDNIDLIVSFIFLVILILFMFFDVGYKRKEKEIRLKEDVDKLIQAYESALKDANEEEKDG